MFLDDFTFEKSIEKGLSLYNVAIEISETKN